MSQPSWPAAGPGAATAGRQPASPPSLSSLLLSRARRCYTVIPPGTRPSPPAPPSPPGRHLSPPLPNFNGTPPRRPPGWRTPTSRTSPASLRVPRITRCPRGQARRAPKRERCTSPKTGRHGLWPPAPPDSAWPGSRSTGPTPTPSGPAPPPRRSTTARSAEGCSSPGGRHLARRGRGQPSPSISGRRKGR